jgi:hypothetical protein
MEAVNTKSLNSAYKHHKTIDFAEWECQYMSKCFADPPLKKRDCVTTRQLFGWLKRILQGKSNHIKSTFHHKSRHLSVEDNTRVYHYGIYLERFPHSPQASASSQQLLVFYTDRQGFRVPQCGSTARQR